ncbi:MAG: MBL fold metallo-hydrolase [Deltaproteobacteria bacterium]|nr:MBL fold metallo-hydrolase [Deltaproteobacteria bacterium]
MDNPVCIDLDQPQLEGFRKFLSAWLYRWGGKTFLVDPGPLSTISILVAALKKLQVKKLDYILLTHIHIDHAGGTGALLNLFPEARVICHPEGVRHLVAPEKLWQGSLKVLGPVAEAYGEILPVPAARVGFEEYLGDNGARAYLSPGHSAHHCCYLIGDILFGGEVAGVRCEVPHGIYMRPATPPRFFLDVALDSIERMLALQPDRMVFGHYGLVDTAMEHLRIGHDQLLLWVRGVIATAGVEKSKREAVFFEWLLARDEYFRNIRQLEPDIFAREQVFLKNSLAGMSGYADSLSESERKAIEER